MYLKSNRIHGLLSNLAYLIQKRDQGTPKSQIHKKQPSFYKLETHSRKIQNTFCTFRIRKYYLPGNGNSFYVQEEGSIDLKVA